MSGSRSADMRRLFVAVDPPPVAVADLGAVVDSLEVSRSNEPGKSTRLAARERWHITLAFLGDVPVDRVDDAATALDRAAAAVDRPDVIRVRFAGGGTFGRGRFTILWAGLGGDVAGLRRLADTVRRELRQARLPMDRKGFRPHLTISRPGARVPADRVASDVATLNAYEGPDWALDAIHLVASELGPNPRHTRLASAALSYDDKGSNGEA